MWQKDEQLHELNRKAARKRYLQGVLKELRAQEKELKERVALLEKESKHERDELDELSGRSLSAFFYAVIGRKDEKLEEEKNEAYAAQAKYDSAKRELDAVREDIAKYNAEYSSLIGFDVAYKKLLNEKKKLLKSKGVAEAARIVELEDKLAELDGVKQDVNEAITASNRAKKAADRVIEYLSHAENWASWDVLGGGMIADVAKHDELDAAQEAVGLLQIELRRLKNELADIAEESDIKVNVSGFLRFADWFFDGIFVDYSIFQRIEESKEKIYDIRNKLQKIKGYLQDLLIATDSEMVKICTELEGLVLDTDV